jgi:ribosomal protein L37AE/L43A
MRSLRAYARECPHTEAQARCKHHNDSTRKDPDNVGYGIWSCHDCDQTFRFDWELFKPGFLATWRPQPNADPS